MSEKEGIFIEELIKVCLKPKTGDLNISLIRIMQVFRVIGKKCGIPIKSQKEEDIENIKKLIKKSYNINNLSVYAEFTLLTDITIDDVIKKMQRRLMIDDILLELKSDEQFPLKISKHSKSAII